MGPGFYNMDCMDAMKQFPDGFFDLAIVDPPYGDGNQNIGGGVRSGQRFDRYKHSLPAEELQKIGRNVGVTRTGGTWATKYAKKIVAWDVAPKQEYFNELFRVSRHQIIWGGQLLRPSTVKEFHHMAQADYQREFQYGNG